MVFGEVVEGMDVVRKVENAPVAGGSAPVEPITIVKSGELEVPEEGIHVEL